VTYTYDGDLSRVKKSSGKLYWYGADGNALAETDLSGNITAEFIYFAGRRIAWRNAAGAVYYIYSDRLGALRAMTNATGVLQKDSDYYPYGGERQVTNIVDLNYKFAGMEYDPETTEYHTAFRQYASNLGRWASPDPVRGRVDFPQGQNLYAYVLSNPTNLTDPLGLNGTSSWPWPCFTWFGCPPAPCPGPPPYPPGGDGGGGGGKPSVEDCSRVGDRKPLFGGCRHICGSLPFPDFTYIPLYKIQKACPPPRPDCPVSLQIEKPLFLLSTPTVVTNPCVYGTVQ
jgi:RHS repeat-associated protein